MHKNSTTKIEVNKIQIAFSKKKMTAYGGFSLLATFFQQISFKEIMETIIPIQEASPNCMGLYSKVIAYLSMIYAGAERFAHLIYLGDKEVMARIFGIKRLPEASTTLTQAILGQ